MLLLRVQRFIPLFFLFYSAFFMTLGLFRPGQLIVGLNETQKVKSVVMLVNFIRDL